jgi:hypothetical protein
MPEDRKFKASLSYIANPVLKNKKGRRIGDIVHW